MGDVKMDRKQHNGPIIIILPRFEVTHFNTILFRHTYFFTWPKLRHAAKYHSICRSKIGQFALTVFINKYETVSINQCLQFLSPITKLKGVLFHHNWLFKPVSLVGQQSSSTNTIQKWLFISHMYWENKTRTQIWVFGSIRALTVCSYIRWSKNQRTVVAEVFSHIYWRRGGGTDVFFVSSSQLTSTAGLKSVGQCRLEPDWCSQKNWVFLVLIKISSESFCSIVRNLDSDVCHSF